MSFEYEGWRWDTNITFVLVMHCLSVPRHLARIVDTS